MKNAVPMYQKIESDLRAAILEGKLKQGDVVPSETELSAQYNVTRMTVRQAINNLLVDGYIYRHKGRGTFVTFNKTEMEENTHYFNFINEPHGIDGQIETKVIKFDTMQADEIIAARLQIKIGENVFYIERLKSVKNIVLAYERLYLPINMYPNLQKDVLEGSLYEYVESLGWKIRNYRIAIESRGLAARVADLLHQKEGEPSLYTSCSTFLDNGRAFEYSRCYLNAQYFRFKYNSLTSGEKNEFR